jgi:hypothetical protein
LEKNIHKLKESLSTVIISCRARTGGEEGRCLGGGCECGTAIRGIDGILSACLQAQVRDIDRYDV